MYFNVIIIFIIFSYQCLMICTLKLGTENYQSGISRKSVGPHDCVVSVPRDGNHMPIPLVTSSAGEPTVIYPDENGKFIIRHESYLNMSCAGSKFTSPSRVVLENVVATCLKGMLMYEGKKYDFDQFKCSRNPKPTLSVTRHICQRMTDRIIEVGFKTGFGFIVLYKVCFDTVFKSTLYTWHVVNPPLNNFRQNSVVEPTLINPYLKDDDVEEEYQKMTFSIDRPGTRVFRKRESIDVLKAYRNQTNVLEEILSKKMADFYISKDKKQRQYLVPDYLIPENDFVYLFQKNATYFYQNTAPQWLAFAEDVWTEVERLVARNAAGCNATRKIVSGTYLAVSFPDPSPPPSDTLTSMLGGGGGPRPFFLLPPERMPVPRHRWTLDYDVASGSGLVYVAPCHDRLPVAEEEPVCETMPCPGAESLSAAARKLVYCCTKDAFEFAYWLDPDVMKTY